MTVTRTGTLAGAYDADPNTTNVWFMIVRPQLRTGPAIAVYTGFGEGRTLLLKQVTHLSR